MKYLSMIIKELENFPYKSYVQKIPKHEPTGSYFYLARKITKCMMISDAFNLHADPIRKEVSDTQHIPISHVCDLDESESKGIVAD